MTGEWFPGLIYGSTQPTKDERNFSLFVINHWDFPRVNSASNWCTFLLPLIQCHIFTDDCQVNFLYRSISPLKHLSDFPFSTSNDTPLKAGTIRFPHTTLSPKTTRGEASVLRVWNKIAGAAFPPRFRLKSLTPEDLQWSEVRWCAVWNELWGLS